MIPPSACQPWQPDNTAAHPCQGAAASTPRPGTRSFCHWRRAVRVPARRRRTPCRHSGFRPAFPAADDRRPPDHAPRLRSGRTCSDCPEHPPRDGSWCSIHRASRRSPGPHRLFWAPALGWWARTMVLSIIAYSLSAFAARAWNTRCRTPGLAQRLNRRCTLFHSPRRSGRSRHGMPAR